MTPLIDSVCITVGAVVLDRPDQSGAFIAKDLAGGWAYVVSDGDGDRRFRGQGACAGGLTTALRYAFVSAVGCVPECRRITVHVDAAETHRQMVRLATADAAVAALIAGRPVFVMTRPHERLSHQVRLSAERAATAALRAREQAEDAAPVVLPPPVPVVAAASRGGWRRAWTGAAATPAPETAPRPLAFWLREFDRSVARLETGLQGISG